MNRRRILAVVLLILAAAAAFAWYGLRQPEVPPGQPPLATLSPASLEGFRDDFNKAAGTVRVIVLLSPT
jgi:hypothetical protein